MCHKCYCWYSSVWNIKDKCFKSYLKKLYKIGLFYIYDLNGFAIFFVYTRHLLYYSLLEILIEMYYFKIICYIVDD